MEQKQIIRPRNYFYEILVILNEVALVAVWWLILQSPLKAIWAGCLTYLVLAWTMRLLFQKHHTNGVRLMQKQKYSDAASAFQKSYEFFKKHPAIDKYRFITMFSSSAIPYRQMALNNLGVCYFYMGENAKALEVFKKFAEQNSNYPNIDHTIEEIEKRIEQADILEK